MHSVILGIVSIAVFYDNGPYAIWSVPKREWLLRQNPLQQTLGLKILKEGGNAVDAAVAVGFALAVTYPGAGNIGGGGFMVCDSLDGTVKSLDYRETAPAAAKRDMYLDKNGNFLEQKSSTRAPCVRRAGLRCGNDVCSAAGPEGLPALKC